jgi:hypothetical protein
MKNWHWLGIAIVAFLIGYYFPMLGNQTVGRIYPRSSS